MENNKTKPQSKFQFIGYRIVNSNLKITERPISNELQFNITPFGTFNGKDNFELVLSVLIHDKNQNIQISITVVGTFKYKTTDHKQLINFIGINAPAIMFPYVRSFISCLTGLSGMEPIIMPTLNMEPVGKMLIKQLSDTKEKETSE